VSAAVAVPRREFDVVVVGGGMVGAALAALLVTQPATRALKVAILEPRPVDPPLAHEPLDLRVSALSRASEAILRTVGAWPRLAERSPCAYERMRVWDARDAYDGPHALEFDAAELGEPDLGHIAENRAIAAALLEQATRHGAALLNAALEGVELEPDVARAVTADRRFTCGLIVAADGADSPARGFAGLGGEFHAYPQSAVVAHLRPERSHEGVARQRFLPDGPLALLPLADGRVSLVWSTRPAEAEELVGLDDDAFAARVTTASDGALGALAPTTPRARFPLRRFHAQSYWRARFALAGDAAHAVHPLAGQGVNLGLLDAAALADVLGRALAAGEDVGDPRVLGRYGRWRRADNALMGAAFDGLYRLFASRHEFVVGLRRTGLGLVERAGPVKRAFVRRALGLDGDLPASVHRSARP
jgi:2-octaprenylphenol hydroxylase